MPKYLTYESRILLEKIQEYMSSNSLASDNARVDLYNRIIESEDLLEALDIVKEKYKQKIENQKNKKHKYKKRLENYKIKPKKISKKTEIILEECVREYFKDYKSYPFNYPLKLENINVNAKEFLEIIGEYFIKQ